MYKDKDRQREAQRERTRRYRDKAKGVTSEGVTPGSVTGKFITLQKTFTDARGTLHSIEHKSRFANHQLLELWANGEGTEYQKKLGLLARQYRMFHYLEGVGNVLRRKTE